MIVALLAAALLAPAPSEEPSPTAGQLYDGCARFAASPAPPGGGDEGQAECAITAVVVLAGNAAQAAAAETDADTREFCLPESPVSGADSDETVTIVRAFIDYVDRNRASRNDDATAVFSRALSEKWPCPR